MRKKEMPHKSQQLDLIGQPQLSYLGSPFVGFQKRIDQFLPSYIPKIWPLPITQIGSTCGLYALYIALLHSFKLSQRYEVPPHPYFLTTNPNENTTIPSMLTIAKNLNCTVVGEILNVDYFSLILSALGFPSISPIRSNLASFLSTLCDLLDNQNTVIVSCDLDPISGFPGISHGVRAHWVLVFGYFYADKELFFLITQAGDNFIWSGSDLLISNSQNPNAIYPKSEQNGYFSLHESSNVYKYHLNSTEDAPPSNAVRIPTTTMQNFYYTLFPVPCYISPQIPLTETLPLYGSYLSA